ncbi:MAG: hypothetical protein KGR98_15400 [Verrucomicrobia bacterium]|nr:hypothetical protein [Verrucomicrobiota bacterium]MDE3099682.1 hypothetical protein [Verrucomicrobiota bacterium]
MAQKFIHLSAWIAGRSVSVCIVVLLIIAWAVTDPIFRLLDDWRAGLEQKPRGKL